MANGCVGCQKLSQRIKKEQSFDFPICSAEREWHLQPPDAYNYIKTAFAAGLHPNPAKTDYSLQPQTSS